MGGGEFVGLPPDTVTAQFFLSALDLLTHFTAQLLYKELAIFRLSSLYYGTKPKAEFSKLYSGRGK